MNFGLTNGLAGLALLGGSGSVFGSSSFKVESRAVRLAKVQFTLPPVAAPWQSKPSSEPLAASVGAIKRMKSIVDGVRSTSSLPPDVQTAFTAYKALDRLRALAEWSARSATTAAERTSLQASFAKGVADLQDYLAVASSDALTLAFDKPSRRAESIAIESPPGTEIRGRAVTSDRFAGLSGLSGAERFTVSLSKGGASDSVTIDLSQVQQPPTLDRIADAFNSAIAAIPQRNPDGTVVTDADGNPVKRWGSSFSVVKASGGWGLQLNSIGLEQVSMGEVGAGDSLVIAAGQTPGGAATSTALMRLDLSATDLRRTNLTSLDAIDRQRTAEAQPSKPAVTVAADLQGKAVAIGTDGFTYIVGTSPGDVGSNLGDGAADLMLSKVDQSGAIVWQRSLGTAGSAAGAALGIAANGDIVVAGTAEGDVNGASSDGDMLVARFSAAGDEKFLTLVRAAGADRASAVAVTSDGSIIVGGRAASGDGDAFLARLDGNGRLVERRLIDRGAGDSVRALQAAPDGSLIALTIEAGQAMVHRIGASSLADNQASTSLGVLDARSIALSADGRIAVGGVKDGDGYVAVLDAGFALANETTISSGGSDQVDSVGWVGGELYAGGRTNATLGTSTAGATDGFVAQIDPASGAVLRVHQWGRIGTEIEPVRIAAAYGADTRLGALGLTSGIINPPESARLVAQASLRAGDSFSIRVDNGAVREIVIGQDDTLATLSGRIAKIAGRNVTAVSAKEDDGRVLRVEAKPGHSVQLIAGPDGHDVLAKLGMPPSRLSAPPPLDEDAPRVRPGGSYGLALSLGLNIHDTRSAGLALGKLKAAMSVTQTAFRSLYWDETKEALVNGGIGGGAVSPYLAGQIARYQDALSRLGGASLFSSGA